MKVKICGMRTAHDVEAAKDADYLGFVLESISPRLLSVSEARDLMSLTGRRKVVVSTSPDIDVLTTLHGFLEPDVLQVQSPQTPSFLEELRSRTGAEIWALTPVAAPMDMDLVKARSEASDMVHLDTPSAQGGGTGRTNDWTVARRIRDAVRPKGCVLAGGLAPHNVAEAVNSVRPEVVDVASGVEVFGVKSPGLIGRFIREAKRE